MTRRILLGKDMSGTFCLRVTLPGYDVLTEDPFISPQKFSFASDFDRIDRVHQVGSFAGVHGDGVAFAPLPYRPLFSIYMREDGVKDKESEINQMDDSTVWASRFVAYVNAGESMLRIRGNQSYSFITLSNSTAFNYDYVIWLVPGDQPS